MWPQLRGTFLDFLLWRLTSLTCVVLHHVLVVSVGGLGEVHAHARHPHGGMSPASKETELSPRVHQPLSLSSVASERGAELLSWTVVKAIIFLSSWAAQDPDMLPHPPSSHAVEQIRPESPSPQQPGPDLERERFSFPPMSWGWRNVARHYRSLVLGLSSVSSHTTKDRRPKILDSDWSTERTSPKYLQWLCLSYGKSLNPACGRGFLAKLPDWVLTKMESGQRKKKPMWLFVITIEGY